MSDETKLAKSDAQLADVLSKLADKVDRLGARALGIPQAVLNSDDWLKPGRMVKIDRQHLGVVAMLAETGDVMVAMYHTGSNYKTLVLCSADSLTPA